MPTEELYTAYKRFMTLMDRAAAAIDRKDLDESGLLEEQVDSCTLEMKVLLLTAITDSTTAEAVVDLKRLLQQALDRVTHNQNKLAEWIAETGMQLGRLQQGARAVHGYGPSMPSHLPLLEQRA
jgi:uncharacterized protein with PhoU and TrkA domain